MQINYHYQVRTPLTTIQHLEIIIKKQFVQLLNEVRATIIHGQTSPSWIEADTLQCVIVMVVIKASN